MTRKPTQIACNQWGIYALCDDGTIWWSAFSSMFSSSGIKVWTEMPSIPQPSRTSGGSMPFPGDGGGGGGYSTGHGAWGSGGGRPPPEQPKSAQSSDDALRALLERKSTDDGTQW